MTLDGGGPFTVFAPTNQAFAKLGVEAIEALLDDVDALKDLLLYHVINSPMAVFLDELVCGVEVLMLNGMTTTTECSSSSNGGGGGGDRPEDDDNAIFQVGMGNTDDDLPLLASTDIEACNGVIHAVDNVILPRTLNTGDGDGACSPTIGACRTKNCTRCLRGGGGPTC